MNGARSLVETLLSAQVDTCFANPGTSEMHFVAALDQVAGMRCVLGLQENIVTGMADGYYRIARKPAATLLHCGPGLANGMGNLHNARRAGSGIVNLVGDQATYHRALDAPLTADTEGMARTVSQWTHTSVRARDVGQDAAAAISAARTYPGQVATLILPSDVCWDEGGIVGQAIDPPAPLPLSGNAIDSIAGLLRRTGHKTLLLLSGAAVFDRGQQLAWQIAQATGADVLAEFGASHLARGRGRMQLERVPYDGDAARKRLAKYEHIVLINAKAPVGFFAYPGKPSRHYSSDTKIHVLSRSDQDPIAALEALAQTLAAPKADIPDAGPRPDIVYGAPTSAGLAQTVAAVMPENAIVSDESISYGRDFYRYTHAAPAHDWLHLAGGAIGDGLPVATGAALGANRQRRVISLQADGSAMYSLQSLWTQARERLPVTTVILNNSSYNVLLNEYKNVGATPGRTAKGMLDLGDPDLSWVKLANGMGVEAARTKTLEECADLMRASFSQDAPFLIELMI